LGGSSGQQRSSTKKQLRLQVGGSAGGEDVSSTRGRHGSLAWKVRKIPEGYTLPRKKMRGHGRVKGEQRKEDTSEQNAPNGRKLKVGTCESKSKLYRRLGRRRKGGG